MAIAVHGEKFDYSQTVITGMSKKTTVVCPHHGAFDTLPKDHVHKRSGCPKCAREQTSSKAEKDIADWIESAGEVIIRNDREALDGLELDVYLPTRRIGIEYHGSYWHHDEALPHPRIHEVKAKRAESKGIRIVTVWDFDWSSKPDLVKRHILHAIGASAAPKVSARSCQVRRVSFVEAKPFYARNHIQGAPWRAIAHYGLFHHAEMVACMSFGQGNSRRGKTGRSEWELLRFATSAIVRGGASKLFAAFLTDEAPESIWSFSDRQHFSGGLYPALGFKKDGDVPADYRVAHQGRGLVWHKSAWKRKHIPDRLAELGISDSFDPETDPRTEREMQALARTVRIMDAGKVRWKWENKNAPEGAFVEAAE